MEIISLTPVSSLVQRYLYDRLITELQLVFRLYQTHSECPHLQQPLFDVDGLRTLRLCLQQTGVHQDEGPGPPDAGGAVNHCRPLLTVQTAGLPDGPQELQEGVRAARHSEVRPGDVVEVEHVTTLLRQCVGQPEQDVRDGGAESGHTSGY